MAAPGGRFFIQERMKEIAPHHATFEQLWEKKWKKPAQMGVYPFMFSTASDFEPVVEELIKKGMREPYDWDEYAQTFFPQAERIARLAEEAERRGQGEKAAELFLRASAVYRISRFPAPRSDQQKYAWLRGKELFMRGQSHKPYPIREVMVPHNHRLPNEGENIPIYHLLPDASTAVSPAPLIVIITGLDGYRTELAVWADGWREKGVAMAILEIPGTGDCPADPRDPTSPDRLFSSLFDWIDNQERINNRKICVWAFSTGGYYAIRLAHTHPRRLAGVVALGGGCHHMFDHAWLDEVNHLEYPFDLCNTLANKFGYGDDVEAFKAEASAKFSLLHDGTLDKPECARLLLVNGTGDEIFPIDDYYLALQHGAPKEARFVPNTKHMGEPESFSIILRWLYNIYGIRADPISQLKTLPFGPKYSIEENPTKTYIVPRPKDQLLVKQTNGINGSRSVSSDIALERVDLV